MTTDVLSNTMLNAICLFFLVISLNSFVVSTPSNRKLLGVNADISNFPHQVSLRRTKTQTHFCAGAILNESFILTAAHCFYDLDNDKNLKEHDIFIVAGQSALKLESTSITRKIKTITRHPSFCAYLLKHNIALLELKEKLPLSNLIKPIALNTVPVVDELKCTMSGWGHLAHVFDDEKKNRTVWETLRKDDFTAYTATTCSKIYPPDYLDYFAVKTMSFCTECVLGNDEPAVEVCEEPDDSGGPLVCKGVLTGIVSAGTNCHKVGHPAVHTDVEQHLMWIQYQGDDHKRPAGRRSNGRSRKLRNSSSKLFFNNYLYLLIIVIAVKF